MSFLLFLPKAARVTDDAKSTTLDAFFRKKNKSNKMIINVVKYLSMFLMGE